MRIPPIGRAVFFVFCFYYYFGESTDSPTTTSNLSNNTGSIGDEARSNPDSVCLCARMNRSDRRRPKKEFQRATLHGALVSVVLAAAVIALTWRELGFSMNTEVVESLFVNSTISPSFNVT